ncbi:MAG: hypothetical protein ABJN26_01385 [Stappiaceae bacterium]
MKRIALISSVIAGAMAVSALLPVASAEAATLPPPPPAKVNVVVVKPAPYYPVYPTPYYHPVHPAVAYGVGYATGHYVATHPRVY